MPVTGAPKEAWRHFTMLLAVFKAYGNHDFSVAIRVLS